MGAGVDIVAAVPMGQALLGAGVYWVGVDIICANPSDTTFTGLAEGLAKAVKI